MRTKGAVRWLAAAAVALLFGSYATAWAQSGVRISAGERTYAGEFEIPIHKSEVLRLDVPFVDLMVGNPEIADVMPLTDRTVYILGKELGSTSLSIYGRSGGARTLLAVVDLVVTHNVGSIRRQLFELMPGETIEVRAAHDSIVLSGMVTSAAQLSNALAVAERYAPGHVTNMLQVRGSQQVMLAVRFAEVKRSVLKDIGVNLDVLARIGDVVISLLTGRLVTGLPAFVLPFLQPDNPFGVAGAGAFGRNYQVIAALDALEQKGVVKTLAEPNLIALSGDTATFLAGGEFPIPVAQSTPTGVTITIEWKEFGVSLAFTPTVIGEDLISLVVAPEVSALDFSTQILVAGTRVPGLTTRRVRTTIELRDGESFAIAGLIQSDFADNIEQLPFAGDVPVLGAMFRSADYRRNETELVVIVTPHLVKPARSDDLRVPTDTFVPPSDADIFLHGRPEAPGSGGASAIPASAGSRIDGGGFDGRFGHIIR